MNGRAAIIVRHAEPHDGAALLRLKMALQVEEGSEIAFAATADQWQLRLFGSDRYFEALVADIGSSVVGMLIFNWKHYTAWPSPALCVQDLFVEPVYRRRGVGRRLLRALALHAQHQNAEHIELVVGAGNPARRLYEQSGFSDVREAITYVAGRTVIADLAKKLAD